jgi:uncharacterized membrane protein
MKLSSSMNGDFGTVMALGAVAGARSMIPLVVVSRALPSNGAASLPMPLSRLGSPLAKNIVALAAVFELIGDKLPGIPARIAPLPLAGRALSGAAAGFVIARRAGRKPALLTALGAACAVAGALGSYWLRKTATERLSSSSARTGLVEDALVLMGAGGVLRRLAR